VFDARRFTSIKYEIQIFNQSYNPAATQVSCNISTTLDKGRGVGSFFASPDSHLDDNASINCSMSSSVPAPVCLFYCFSRVKLYLYLNGLETKTYLRSGLRLI
jgi:hypothetical protein